ncbi:MAG: DNA-binding LacI/PurR family transcriptional regulator [Cryomorphaceae bacterium]|jgi:DNA-binding LacI/PurR family transcriptional regulator
MSRIKTATLPEQVAVHLREGIASGRWVDVLPGRDILASELGVSARSVQKALQILEKEGLLASQGKGRRHKIELSGKELKGKCLRVGIFSQSYLNDNYMLELRHQLDEAGHVTVMPRDGMEDLYNSLKQVKRVVRAAKVDAWVLTGASQEILQWFVDHDIKVFALAGRRFQFPIAGTGPNKAPLYGEVTRKLIDLGHRRIVMICQKALRHPEPNLSARVFLDTLQTAGIPTGDYNLPDWDVSEEGFQDLLDKQFRTTPPTALILDEAYQYYAAYQYMASHNLRVPHDVSLVCTDRDPGFIWCRPSVAHMYWDYHPVVRRIIRWVNNVARGVDDRRQSFTKAEYIDGGTVGPAPE